MAEASSRRAEAAGRPRVICIGECMVEVSFSAEGPGFAGDTFNTAVYLSRLGADVSYATVLGGDDPFTLGMLAMMQAEGIDQRLVARAPGRLPGLYMIRTAPDGERSFHYWRGQAPVRDFASLFDLDALRRAIEAADLVYLSGVTLAVIGGAGRAALLPLLRGRNVAFDLNYRPQLWASPEEAAAAVEEFARASRFVSFGLEEAQVLFGTQPHGGPDRWSGEQVRRHADAAVTVAGGEERLFFPGEEPAAAVDTTGAGDSFNAAYIYARLRGEPPHVALARGRALAREVVQHRGAIIPRTQPPLEPGEGRQGA